MDCPEMHPSRVFFCRVRDMALNNVFDYDVDQIDTLTNSLAKRTSVVAAAGSQNLLYYITIIIPHNQYLSFTLFTFLYDHGV